jgi:hypothetical protein
MSFDLDPRLREETERALVGVPLPPRERWYPAQRPTRFPSVAVALTAVTLVIASLGVGRLLAGYRAPVEGPAAIATPTAPAASCTAPPRPAYLPWGTASVPSETREGTGVFVRYEGPALQGGPTYFTITRQENAQGLPHSTFVKPRQVGDRFVVMYWVGDPGVGEVAAWWREGQGCDVVIARLTWHGGGRDAIETELTKVVASLPAPEAVGVPSPLARAMVASSSPTSLATGSS